jgi:hypothetical protein
VKIPGPNALAISRIDCDVKSPGPPQIDAPTPITTKPRQTSQYGIRGEVRFLSSFMASSAGPINSLLQGLGSLARAGEAGNISDLGFKLQA